MTDVYFGIAPSTVARLQALMAATPGIQRVWIFGSRAQGNAREESDIDLAVEAPEWTVMDRARLSGGIEGLMLLYPVDLVWLSDKLDPKFRARIEREIGRAHV